MKRVIRFLVFSAFFLIAPMGATPPAKYSCPGSLPCRNIRGKTVLIRKYLLLRRFLNSDESRSRIQICNITVVMVVNRVTPADTLQPAESSTLFSIGTYRQCQSIQEAVHARTINRPLLPML